MTNQKDIEKVASVTLNKCAAASGSNVIQLTTIGRPMSVFVGPLPSAPAQVTHQDIKHIQTHAGMSQNQTMKMAEDLRMIGKNRKLIQPHLKKFLSDNNMLFDDLFDIVENSGMEGVFCNDVNELIKRVSERRGHDDEPVMFKLGLDSGRGSLKASISLLFAGDEMLESEATSGPKKGRICYEDGLSSAKIFKDNGVKKLLLLAVLPNTAEDYDSIQSFLSKLNLPPSKFLLCADLKVNNCALGLMPHSSRHPCLYCHWIKGSDDPHSELRTFEGIINCNIQWKQAGSRPSKLKEHFNCRNEPLSIFPREGIVIDYLPLSELHLMIGIVNKMFMELERVFPDAIKWPQGLHLVKEDYHHQFEGNECYKLLCKTNALSDIITHSAAEKHQAIKYANAFQAMGHMVQSCFGRDLKEGWQGRVTDFCDAYQQLGISITTKVHIVKDHLLNFCEKNGCGLARYSEQSFEAVHADFAKYWERHQIKDKSSDRYGERLRQTVKEYNSAHI